MSKRISLVVLGEGGVGKSACTTRFIDGTYSDNWDPTIEDCYTKMIEFDGEPYTLEILDTAGISDGWCGMRDLAVQRSQGILFVYCVDRKRTLEDLKETFQRVNKARQNLHGTFPMVLVGNKCDLTNREVSREDGEKFATDNNCTFFETSAKDNINIEEAFTSLIQDADKTKTFEQTSRK